MQYAVMAEDGDKYFAEGESGATAPSYLGAITGMSDIAAPYTPI